MRKDLILVGVLAAASSACGNKNKNGASVDTEDRGMYASLATLEAGRVAAAFYHRSHREPGESSSDKVGALIYVTGEVKGDGGVRWGDDQRLDGDVREEGQHDVGLYASIAIGADGFARISYYDKTSGDLKLATQLEKKEWRVEVVDSAGNVGGWTSLVMDGNDPRIAYYDFDNGDLKIAVKNGAGAWNVIKVDGTDTDSGKFASLASDGNGGLGIAYYDATNADLRYVTGTATGFGAPEIVDGAGDTGQWPSLAYDAGTALIAYQDFTNQDLRLARRDGGASWALSTVDPGDWVGADTSIAVGNGGEITVAYMDGLNNDLNAATWDGQAWALSKIAEVGANGYFNNVVLDAEDAKPIFGTYDYTTTEFNARKPL